MILDENENLATNEPLVQLLGVKSGRRWAVNHKGSFFKESVTDTDRWALRYGGKKEGNYVFEIINRHEPKTTDVLQTVHVTEKDFLKGFCR